MVKFVVKIQRKYLLIISIKCGYKMVCILSFVVKFVVKIMVEFLVGRPENLYI